MEEKKSTTNLKCRTDSQLNPISMSSISPFHQACATMERYNIFRHLVENKTLHENIIKGMPTH